MSEELRRGYDREYLEITMGIGCPVNCVKYCPQEVLVRQYRGSKKLLGFSDFKRLLSTVPPDVGIVFAGYCEPFVSKDLADCVGYVHDAGYTIGIGTTLFNATEQEVKEIVKFKWGLGFCVHLNDGKVVRFPITQKDQNNLTTAIHKVPNLTFSLMNDNFVSNNRENIIRGNLTKPRKVGYCRKLHVPQFVLLPNGDVHLCCMDFSLEHYVGNLFQQSYLDIRKEWLKTDRQHYRLCTYCSQNHPRLRHFLATIVKKGRTASFLNPQRGD